MIKNDKRSQTPHHFMNPHQQMGSPSYPNNQHNMQHRDQSGAYNSAQQNNQHQNNGHYKQQMSNQRRPMSRQSNQGSSLNAGNNRSYQSLRNQTIDSSGPDVRIRGTIYQIFEKYAALARDATLSGDRVLAENLLQHGEHYMRLINEINVEISSDPRQNFQYQNQPQPSMQFQPPLTQPQMYSSVQQLQPQMQPSMQQQQYQMQQPLTQQPLTQQPLTQQPVIQQPSIQSQKQALAQQTLVQPTVQPQFQQASPQLQTKLRMQRTQSTATQQPVIIEEDKVKFQSSSFD